jgi:hypothetical protein
MADSNWRKGDVTVGFKVPIVEEATDEREHGSDATGSRSSFARQMDWVRARQRCRRTLVAHGAATTRRPRSSLPLG